MCGSGHAKNKNSQRKNENGELLPSEGQCMKTLLKCRIQIAVWFAQPNNRLANKPTSPVAHAAPPD